MLFDSFAEELGPYSRTKSSLHLPFDRPLPAALIRRLVRNRVAALSQVCPQSVSYIPEAGFAGRNPRICLISFSFCRPALLIRRVRPFISTMELSRSALSFVPSEAIDLHLDNAPLGTVDASGTVKTNFATGLP